MKKKSYYLECLIILFIASIIYYFGSYTHTNFRNLHADYELSSADLGMPGNLGQVTLANQYYRIMDSTNIAKLTYFNFDTSEKVEIVNHCYSIGWALAKVESLDNKKLKNNYKLIPLRNLHESLPAIESNI